MKRLLLIPLAAAAMSCSRHIPVPVTASHSESAAERHFSSDTIYVGDSIHLCVKGDTVRETRLRTVYRTRTLRDTVTISVTDTVPSIIEVEKTSKSRDSPLETLGRYSLGAILGIIMLLLLKRHGNIS